MKGPSVMHSVRILLSVLLLSAALSAQSSVLRSGPMVGYGQLTEVMLWVQTVKPASIQYRYWYADAPDMKWSSTVSKTTEEGIQTLF